MVIPVDDDGPSPISGAFDSQRQESSSSRKGKKRSLRETTSIETTAKENPR
jgi:hypothetical protein